MKFKSLILILSVLFFYTSCSDSTTDIDIDPMPDTDPEEVLSETSNLLSFIIEANNKGRYVRLGGDFNHELPGADSSIFTYKQDYPDWIQSLPSDFTPQGYTWAIDPNTPTVRDLMKPYVAGDNFVAVIDGFLVSDNIEIIKVKTEDLGFVNSDHNPVILEFSLQD